MCNWNPQDGKGTLLRENRRLVTDAPVEFEKLPVEAGDFWRIAEHFRRIYRRIYLKLIKENPGDVNM